MNISSNSVVALTYELHTTTPEGNQVFVEKANDENPLVFLYGVGMMLPKFEEHLTGLKAGDEYSFELSPSEGYGEIDPAAHVDLPITMFKEAGGELPNVGDVIPLQDNQGNQFRAGVTGVHEEFISVDLNHPMAGKNLIFSGKILNVRQATEDELSHGHAHGIDGHSGH
ncbi:FKBP-type peptidyl-prolyl cis-trans isomerase [Pedobacter montanisoli]|uniref:Peptidyl-prolyl cis-trans isomerase n=1 Tax=Pedobacter montanisoli TaxID=2923277 RepID=A0ABS9ZVM3_9SPHI|nr:FKBP-type peptidyl-prolyl cis-trans isomerase [Pedobacter montanisoli]MCJ0742352.1 FKBP-type peptidyl-prolyl cis-trans isomerase [Pedobacter montanisoli]